MNSIKRAISALLVACLSLVPVTLSSATPDGAGTWQINLNEAEIGEFITQVSRITGKTFVVDQRVRGRITVVSSASLDADGVYELFLSVLRVNGFAAVPAGDVIKIVQQTLAKQSGGEGDFEEDAAGESMITRVIGAVNIPSTEIVKILRPLIPQYSHLASLDQPNVVIISDHAENIRRLEQIVQEIDVVGDEEIVVVPLEEAWVDNMVALLEELAPAQLSGGAADPRAVQVVANSRNNSLVLRGPTEPLQELRDLIDRLDQPASQTGSTRVFRLRYSDAEQVSTILDGILSQQSQSGTDRPVDTTIQPDTSLNAIVVRADPSTMAEVATIIEELDVRRTQVLIEAAIVEVSLNDSESLGVDFTVVDRGGDQAPLVVSPLTGALQSLLGAAVSEGDVTTADLDLVGAAASVSSPTLAVAKLSNGISFAAVLQALGTNSDSDLLSTPSILTLDNEEASIVVGQNVPFRTGSFTSTNNGANNPFTTIQREDVGITLRVIPHVHDGDAVRLEVEQEVSSVVNAANVGDTGFSDIVTNKRTIETTILADDGQTIVLGGLIQDDIIETRRHVPFLSDIPLAGRLFESNSVERVKRNLLVFLRPTIVRDDESAGEITDRKYHGVWEVSPGSDRVRLPEEIDAIYQGREEAEE